MQVRMLTQTDDRRRVFAVVLDAGEEIAASLEEFARETGADAASFTAIGAISTATLGFFDPELGDYRGIPVTEQAEVVSLVGDITRGDDGDDDDSKTRTVHGHIVVARSDGSTIGGHLIRASVYPTLEVVVHETPAHLRRSYDPRTGLALIDLGRSDGSGETDVAGGDPAGRS